MVGIKKTKKRKDIVIKAVNTGCAVFVRLTNLHQKEALRQLSDTSFHAKVDKDLTFINQNIVKNAISSPLQKISPVTLLELCVFTFYLKSTNLTSQADPSFLPAVVHRTHFQLFRQNYGTYVKTLLSYIKDSQHALEVFVTLTSFAKTNLFLLWILHLFIVIPNNGGLGALKYFFDQRIVKEPSSETLLRLAEVVLILNYFSLGGN